LEDFEPETESITLIPSDGGRFEVTVNGRLLYSKLAANRFPAVGEVTGLVGKYLKEGS
jgi:selenoprotein W-related protein